jgi:hypothetical protein
MVARRFRILVCRGPECGDRRGSATIHAAFVHELAAQGVGERCELAVQSCFGRCTQGPNVLVRELPVGPVAAPRFALADLPPRLAGGPKLATWSRAGCSPPTSNRPSPSRPPPRSPRAIRRENLVEGQPRPVGPRATHRAHEEAPRAHDARAGL